ncbi:MAG: hypothetical protein ACPGGL_10060 [Phycisphaerales bacterium]
MTSEEKREMKSLIESLSDVRDFRNAPSDGRLRAYRQGFKHALDETREDYASRTLCKVTWQNLGFRVAKEFGEQTDEWIDLSFRYAADLM